MDFYRKRYDLEDVAIEPTEPSLIQGVYEGKTVFITGASGFMGRVLMEKLLRTCNVAKMYILVRDKKGVKCEDRLSTIFDDLLFEPLKLEKPGELRKVTIVSGDCSLPDLGLSELDKTKMSEVNIIFHAAATLYMDQHLKVAYNTNVLATKILLEFAKTLPGLQAFMYVSTAYTHAYKDLVEEKFYDVVFDEEELGEICSQLDEAQIGALTPKLLGRWGNTYALTKACTEDLIAKYDGILPIGIVRPSIVMNTNAEPLVGWINNVYGAVGVVLGTGFGLLRVWCAAPDKISDLIPVDIAINMTLAATWEVITKNTQVKIYNCVSSALQPLTWKEFRSIHMNITEMKVVDSLKAFACPKLYLIKNKLLFQLFTIWYHVIPAIFMDLFLQIIGKQPLLMKLYIKVYTVNLLLAPYCAYGMLRFTSDNVNQMWDNLLPRDRMLFNFDLKAWSWPAFFLNSSKGLRVYLLKDPMDTLPDGIRHAFWLKVKDFIIVKLIWLAIAFVIYFYSKKVFPTLFYY